MKLGAMLSDVLQSLVKVPVTERYPYHKKAAPARLRGKLLWNREKCTACGLCAKDCPANALEVIAIDKKTKQIVMHYDMDHCIFCGQCVFSCRQGCMALPSTDWELAALTRAGYAQNYGEEADVRAVLEGQLADRAAPANGD
jgi:formate hydrogenlyase subunit 6/NADH:ubiquinone oxidoreductase subunit I